MIIGAGESNHSYFQRCCQITILKSFIFLFSQEIFKTLSYYLLGDDQATTFFRIAPDTGVISVARDLKTDDEEFYTVSNTPLDGQPMPEKWYFI